MPQVNCPTLTHCFKENECLENLAGLGNAAYVFIKSDLEAPLTRTGTKYSTPAFKAGKGLYKFELQDQMQGIVGESLKKRQGFKQTLEFAFEAVNEAISSNARALNNLDVGFIVPDNEKYQIMYDPYHDIKFEDGGIKTEDGGYAVLLEEGDANTDAVPYVWRDFLVKVDAEGRVQWINRESFERDNLSVRGMFSHNGKIVVYCGQVRGSDEDPAQPWVFRWFDEDGKEIGTTEIKLNAEDFSVMSQYLEPEEEGVRREPVISFAEEIPMGDELWALGVCYANEWNGDEETGTCVESRELVLVRLPELE